MRKLTVRSLLVILALAVAGCSTNTGGTPAAQPGAQTQGTAASAPKKEYGTLRFAPQFGMAYLPHHVMIKRGFLEKHLPGVKVEEIMLSGGGAVTEQIIAGTVDVGYMGTAPYLKAWDKGVEVRIAAGLEQMPMKLVTWKPEIKSLKDFKATDKIALPGPASYQNTTLSVAAKQQLGDANALSRNVVGLAHPDAEAALRSKLEIAAHFGQLPFQRREAAQPGYRVVLSSYDVFGPHTLIVMVVGTKFQKERPEVYNGLVAALTDAVNWIRENPGSAADLMIEMGDRSTKEELMKDLTDREVLWSVTPTGIMKLARGMKETGEISKVPGSWKDVVFPNLHSLDGN